MGLFSFLYAATLATLWTVLFGAITPERSLHRIADYNKIPLLASELLRTDLFNNATRQTKPTSPAQVANISRSRLGYSQTSGFTAGVVIPGQHGVTYTFSMKGSIKFNGTLSSDIQDVSDNLVLQYSSEFQAWYKEELKSLKARARGGFFSFFQAAANYGYTSNKRTQDILQTDEFKSFSEKAGASLNSVSTQELEGSFDGSYSGVSSGVRETVSMFGYVYINQITLDSGKIFNVVSKNPALVIADENGTIRNDSTTFPVGPSIGDNIIDTEIGS